MQYMACLTVYIITVYLSPDDVLSLPFFLVLQDAGVLPQPAERQLFSCADSSRAETSESHQPSAE